jgi:hypothetical protein
MAIGCATCLFVVLPGSRPVTEFQHDPVTGRPKPDREILVRAHAHMLRTQPPMQAYLRQQWEVTMSALRVALDAWRKVWPIEGMQFEPADRLLVTRALTNVEGAYNLLDHLSERMLGVVMDAAQRGELTIEALEEFEHDQT